MADSLPDVSSLPCCGSSANRMTFIQPYRDGTTEVRKNFVLRADAFCDGGLAVCATRLLLGSASYEIGRRHFGRAKYALSTPKFGVTSSA